MKIIGVQPTISASLLLNSNCKNKPTCIHNNTSFQSKLINCRRIQNDIYDKYHVSCYFSDNEFLANCVSKTVKLFNKLFGASYLPSRVSYESLSAGIEGVYKNFKNEIAFNSKSKTYKNKFHLKVSSLSGWNFLLPNDKSSLHSAHIFTHEFGHCAHWHHLESRHGVDSAQKVWTDLEGYMVPDSVGKLIIRYKLGNYAVDSEDMCEFMAERIAKDICDNLSGSSWKLNKQPDIDYTDIFQRKWEYRYTNPQSYLDYFTQQVWNGDTEEALIAADRIKYFLKLVDEGRAVNEAIEFHNSIDPPVLKVRQLSEIKPVKEVHPIVESVKSHAEESPFLSPLANSLYVRNSILTRMLDDKNRILLRL